MYKTMYRPMHPGFRNVIETREQFPKTNISKSESGFRMQIAIPGFAKEEIDIRLDGNQLMIKGDVKTEPVDEKTKSISTGFQRKSFELKYELGDELLNTEIKAEQKDGILNIWLPFNENHKRPAQKIEVK